MSTSNVSTSNTSVRSGETLVQTLVRRPGLIFEQGSSGLSGASLDAPSASQMRLIDRFESELATANLARDTPAALAEVTEAQVVRHYTRLSQLNYSIDTTMIPLGSCSMKHNPRMADRAAAIPGLANVHPYQPQSTIQGTLQLMSELESLLAEISGFAGVTLQPAAGAQGELAGLMMFRAYLRDIASTKNTILIPDSAHGTNPATCRFAGFEPVTLKSNAQGVLDMPTLMAALDDSRDDVAGLMITNPNTVGLFEPHIVEIVQAVRDKGGLIYMDGANLNAVLGKFRPGEIGVDAMHFNLHKTFATPHGGGGPGAGPVGVSKRLLPYLPTPSVLGNERDGYATSDCTRNDWTCSTEARQRNTSIGRLRSFAGNVGVLIRAYAYIREYGDQIAKVSERAVLNANYIRSQIKHFIHVEYDQHCMHEVIASDRDLSRNGASAGVQTGAIKALDVAKGLIDQGFHPPTMYFPLVVPGALMIEPTESESKYELDQFIAALKRVVDMARTADGARSLHNAPTTSPNSRLDETTAARKPILRYTGSHVPS